MIIYAHRGASKHAPENTMPAFDLAYKHEADGIETDVQLTKDGVAVLIHDEKLQRTTNGYGFVKDYTYDELIQLDAGSWKSPKFTNTVIPTLEDLLRWNQDKQLKLNIELKNNVIAYSGLEKTVYQLLQKYSMVKQTVISSFNHDSIAKLKQWSNELDYAFLTSKRDRNLVPFAQSIHAAGIHIQNRLLSNRLVAEAQQHNLYVAVYTVNLPLSIKRAIRMKCHAMFTDIPKLAVDLRKNTR
ncbi:glycerophosphodiester phosphodiesterase [Gracilibacillus caseinilyticus]|uniref:Glycerophosphodiester phosphodiesterase n=1 Tax=Gracilibacillus caseinilyticus TaxID=2932256 RepID=A0ABY4EUH1_9BACI|nr:glycerophosphodiester phosphodiesterase [Gracilibacillus caseinilyticus]UOQ47517.1 glycerophosphodiester phosphodiesterase [Gracilibacillus caseinilyticus]